MTITTLSHAPELNASRSPLAGESIRSFLTSDHYQIHYRHWRSALPKAIIVAAHGIQSHSGWYYFSSSLLAEHGYEVYFADRRGSGLNDQDRGHADHGDRLINDVRQLVQIARDEHAGQSLPVILMGISWGGKIMAALAAQFPEICNGLALLYPGLDPRLQPTRFQKLQLMFARDFEIKRKPVEIPLRDPRLFTDDLDAQKFIASDPLTIHTVTSGFMNAGIDLQRRTASTRITCRTLLMLAGQDQIIDNDRTFQRVSSLCDGQLTIQLYPQACHTLEFDANRQQFLNDVLTWLSLYPVSGRR